MAGSESSQPDAAKLTLVEHENYLEARLAAVPNIGAVRAQLEELLKVAAEKRPPRMLVDFRAIAFEPTFLDRYGLGILGSRFAAHVERAVCVADQKFIDPRKLGAQVAQNRGMQIEIFSDYDAAVAWLTAP